MNDGNDPMSDSEVHYVAAGTATGWAAISKVSKDVDDVKVKECRKNIDTLFIFSGLFSSVLSAFLVRSYPNLSPDKTDTVIDLLSQISAQTSSYTVVANSVNSTVQAFNCTTGSSEPSSIDICINALWFASLIITLTTASFAILVKQWLSNYPAAEHTSPRAHMRALQSRHLNFRAWKVFEIAAFLPLLLQLALGLFFVGLCSFAWSAHPGIGQACISLVSGWALTSSGAPIVPLISPTCPYNIPILKDVAKLVHPKLSIARTLRTLRAKLGAARSWIAPLFTWRGVQGVVNTVADVQGLLRQSSILDAPSVEEDGTIEWDGDELGVLKEVDILLLDDQLLATTMLDSLSHPDAPPEEIVRFALLALDNRLGKNLSAMKVGSILDLRGLSRHAWLALSDILVSAVMRTINNRRHGNQQPIVGFPDWMEETMYLLMSLSNNPPSTELSSNLTHEVLVPCFEYIVSLSDNLPAEQLILEVLTRCLEGATADLEYLLQGYDQKELSPGLLECLHPLIMSSTRKILYTETESWPKGCYFCLGALFSWSNPDHSTYDETLEILSGIFRDARHVSSAICALVSSDPQLRIARGLYIATTFTKMCLRAGQQTILRHLTDECSFYALGTGIEENKSMNPVRLLTLALGVYKTLPQTSADQSIWRDFNEACVDALNNFWEKHYNLCGLAEQRDTALLAQQCLSLVDELDDKLVDRDIPFTDWCSTVDITESIFPDKLYVQLSHHVSKRAAARSRRVNRVRVLSAPLRVPSLVLLPPMHHNLSFDSPEIRLRPARSLQSFIPIADATEDPPRSWVIQDREENEDLEDAWDLRALLDQPARQSHRLRSGAGSSLRSSAKLGRSPQDSPDWDAEVRRIRRMRMPPLMDDFVTVGRWPSVSRPPSPYAYVPRPSTSPSATPSDPSFMSAVTSPPSLSASPLLVPSMHTSSYPPSSLLLPSELSEQPFTFQETYSSS